MTTKVWNDDHGRDRTMRAFEGSLERLASEWIERIVDATRVVPAVNQVELRPRLQQPSLRAYHCEQGIVTDSWSPLRRGALLDDPVVTDVATQTGRTPAQVLLRWNTQLGCAVIPRSVRAARIEEIAQIFDFELEPRQMAAIEQLDREQRIGPDPARFD